MVAGPVEPGTLRPCAWELRLWRQANPDVKPVLAAAWDLGLGKASGLHVPPFPHLQGEDNTSTHLRGLVVKIK